MTQSHGSTANPAGLFTQAKARIARLPEKRKTGETRRRKVMGLLPDDVRKNPIITKG